MPVHKYNFIFFLTFYAYINRSAVLPGTTVRIRDRYGNGCASVQSAIINQTCVFITYVSIFVNIYVYKFLFEFFILYFRTCWYVD